MVRMAKWAAAWLCLLAVVKATALSDRQKFNAKDFVFDFNTMPAEGGEGGTIQSMNLGNVPALDGLGVSYTKFTIKPCGSMYNTFQDASHFFLAAIAFVDN